MQSKLLAVALSLAGLTVWAGDSAAEDIRIRDPFVVTDRANGRYLLVSSCFQKPYRDGFGFLGKGVQIYESKDLKTFSKPMQILQTPEWMHSGQVWAPEMHEWKGRWYVLATINYTKREPGVMDRGTWTFVADSPMGPFVPTARCSVTPPEWNALDGTLWVEDGKPYMVFCHEWTQVGDGEMCVVALSDDLSAPIGGPRTLFKASDWNRSASADPKCRYVNKVTDGPFLYRSQKSGKLFMIWSNVLASGYADLICESATGRLAGPWTNHRVLFGQDGGHGMIFRKLDGSLALTLHQPNKSPDERAKFFDLVDDGESLRMAVRPVGHDVGGDR